MDTSYLNDAEANTAADNDDLFDDDELDALYDEFLAKNAQNAQNAHQKEDTSMDMS